MKSLRYHCLAIVIGLLAGALQAKALLPEFSALSLAPGAAGRTQVCHDGRTICYVHAVPRSAGSGVTLALRDGAIVIDNRGAPPAELRWTQVSIYTIKQRQFPGSLYVLRVQIQGPKNSHAKLFFEGQTLDGVHYHNHTPRKLNGERQELQHYQTLPKELTELHLRLDLTGPGEYKIFAAEFAEVPMREKDPAIMAARVPELLFHADFDGTVTARHGAQPEPMAAHGIDYAPGVKGQALKSSCEAGTLLQYAMAGNALPECGTVSFWYRPLWTRMEDDVGLYVLFTMERPTLWQRGTGSVFLWCCCNKTLHGGTGILSRGALRSRNVQPDQWQHLAMSWDEDGALIYYNGQPSIEMMASDSYSPLAVYKRLVFRDTLLKSFFVGNLNGRHQCDGLIDDLRVYSAPLAPEDVLALAREVRYFEIAAPRRYLVQGNDDANTLAFSITPQQPAAMRFRWQIVAEDGRVVAASNEALTSSAADVGQAKTLTATVPALAPGRYEIRVTEDLYKGSDLDSQALPVWVFHDANAEVSAADELRLEPVTTIRPNPSMSADELLYIGMPSMGELAGRPYMEIDGVSGSRFVLRLKLPDAAGIYLLEWDYPD
ncbi:MAG: LamG domain-containing protein, partial [Lentisphaerae bacterium]|nr:LamG domain-containing protein [Lentisphaerota bacterium]